MTKLREKYGDWALVAGSALGIGEAFCDLLAQSGMNLIMLDNRKEQLLYLSEKLELVYSIKTIPLAIDLNREEALDKIMEITENMELRLLLYVAAFSQIKKFENYTIDDLNHYVNINVSVPIKLAHGFSKRLIDRKQSGGILFMSSLAGLLGMQYIVPYAASKAFIWNLAESLSHELKSHKIDVMACIAGATATEAYLETNPHYGLIKPQVMEPAKVAELALKKLGKKTLFIPGFSNRFNYFILTRILPREWASKIANSTMKKMYTENIE